MLISILYNPLYICSKLVGCCRIKQFWYRKLVFFVVFGLFHTSAFRIREKNVWPKKEVGFGRLFLLYPFTYSYLPKTCFSLFVGIKRIYFCIGFINNCDVTFCTPNAETFFISPWEESLFCCFFSVRKFSRAFFEHRTLNTELRT